MAICLLSFYVLVHGLAAAVLSQPEPAAGRRPHIIHILVDDWGWASAGWHRAEGITDVRTPRIDALLGEGVELDRLYTHYQCGPSRSAIQSGRSPIHVNAENTHGDRRNAADPEAGYAGIPRSMTGMAEHMKAAGYSTHMVGKWDVGMATPQHIPSGRGYDDGIYLFHHSNDFWNMTANSCGENYDANFDTVGDVIDLWQHNSSYDGPAYGRNNSLDCSQANQAPHCVYEDQLFADEVLGVVERHDPTVPLFVFWAPLSVHSCQRVPTNIPNSEISTRLQLQVPDAYLQNFADVDHEPRRLYHAQVSWLDDAVGNLAEALRERGMWEDTLLLIHSDNGGATYTHGFAGAGNHPLKGGKRNLWEGGIRVNALLTGGFLPAGVRGTRQEGYIAAWDWYATWAALAGVDPTDHRANAAGLPPIDSLNMWPLLSGQVPESPRTELVFSHAGLFDTNASWHEDPLQVERIIVGAVISHQYKIVLGSHECSAWTAPEFPSGSSVWTSASPPFSGVELVDNLCDAVERCGRSPETGCLFDIRADPEERENLAAVLPDIFHSLLARAEEEQGSLFAPDRGGVDPAACWAVEHRYNGFWGPFAHLDDGGDEALALHVLHAAHDKCSYGSWVDGICLSQALRPKRRGAP